MGQTLKHDLLFTCNSNLVEGLVFLLAKYGKLIS